MSNLEKHQNQNEYNLLCLRWNKRLTQQCYTYANQTTGCWHAQADKTHHHGHSLWLFLGAKRCAKQNKKVRSDFRNLHFRTHFHTLTFGVINFLNVLWEGCSFAILSRLRRDCFWHCIHYFVCYVASQENRIAWFCNEISRITISFHLKMNETKKKKKKKCEIFKWNCGIDAIKCVCTKCIQLIEMNMLQCNTTKIITTN